MTDEEWERWFEEWLEAVRASIERLKAMGML